MGAIWRAWRICWAAGCWCSGWGICAPGTAPRRSASPAAWCARPCPAATPGDLSYALPYRHLSSLLEALEALDRFAPGIGSRHTLLYGIEVKFYSARPHLTSHLETEVHNLFAVGDGAGVTRGLVQASASGLLAAREVKRRVESGE